MCVCVPFEMSCEFRRVVSFRCLSHEPNWMLFVAYIMRLKPIYEKHLNTNTQPNVCPIYFEMPTTKIRTRNAYKKKKLCEKLSNSILMLAITMYVASANVAKMLNLQINNCFETPRIVGHYINIKSNKYWLVDWMIAIELNGPFHWFLVCIDDTLLFDRTFRQLTVWRQDCSNFFLMIFF